MDGRNLKTPEQVQINDVIPVWGEDLIVEKVEFMNEKNAFGSSKGYAKITFTDGSQSVYGHGSVIAVVDVDPIFPEE